MSNSIKFKKTKKPMLIKEQVELFKSRGCYINSEDKAEEILSLVNYYRLTSYFIPFKLSNEKYKKGTIFENVYKIYEFDKKLRHLISEQIETIEIMFRMRLAYYHCHSHGTLGYLDKANFKQNKDHDIFLKKIKDYKSRNEQNPIIKHHKIQYNGSFPIWVIIEFFDFGVLSKFYANMRSEVQKKISKSMNIRYDYIHSWLLCLTNLRNCCAHHERLYNKPMKPIPKTPINFEFSLSNSLLDYLLVIKFLVGHTSEWTNSFLPSLGSLIDKYGDYIDINLIGFKDNWEEMLTSPTKYIYRQNISNKHNTN